MDYLILVGALVMIIVAATLLTDGSVALAKRLHIPEFIVGLTVMAVGTSMPELTVSMLAALGGHGDMAIGNVVGSNIFNVFAILGICAIFAPIMFTKKNVRRDIPMCIAATVALLVVTLTGATISRLEGVLLLAGYVAMIWWTIRADKKEQQLNPQAAEEEGSIPTMPLWRIPVWIVLGLAGLIYGGELFVTSATNIAKALGVSEAVIAITLLAGGTSLPELAASLVSIFKGSASLALGNVLGSNGSVIPRFREQISKGGPITVTHPEITRFFMTIPEACRLVMEAATMSTGNQIYVFDMGESVKIVNLAKRMVKLAGLTLGKDIQIEYIGLRPGEKLYEEVLSNAEDTDPTSHDRIRVAHVREYKYSDASELVDKLEVLSRAVEIESTVRLMKESVPEFISKNSRFEKLDKQVG